MREGAIFPSVVDPQVPDNGCKQDDRTFNEKIALSSGPGFIEVQHDGIGRLVSVADVGHKIRVDGIAAVRAAWVVEIDDIEGRNLLISLLVLQ